MTQEEKQLLLKDLCGRLPYGVKVKYLYWDEDKGCEYPVPMILDDINSDGYIRFHGDIADGEGRGYILTYLPYLRPMSSMTEKEKFEIWGKFYEKDGRGFPDGIKESMVFDYVDWLNIRHFDFRGLIEKGLALEAPEGMYKAE
jgi:hypothetical protein